MIRNYKIDQGVSIEGSGIYFDIHNNYSLKYLSLSIIDNKFSMRFELDKEFKNNNIIENFDLLFLNLNKLIINLISMNEKNIVSEIGFKESNDSDLNWLDCESNIDSNYDIVFIFSENEFIRINSEFSEFRIINSIQALV